MHGITLRHLRAALSVAKHSSFRRAAEEMNLTQPALSITISDLETDLGLRLFDRTSRMVTVSDIGVMFLQDAARIVGDFDQLIDRTTDIAKSKLGRVTVSCPASIAGRFMPSIVAACGVEYPDIEIQIKDQLVDETLQSVAEGASDFGVTVKPPALRDRLVTTPLLREFYHVVCPRNHVLAKAKSVSWEDLNNQTYVAFSPRSGSQSIIEARQKKKKVTFSHIYEVEQLATVLGMIEEEVGLTILPRMALPHPQHPVLVSRELDDPSLFREIVVVRRKDRSLSPAAEAMMGLVVQAAESFTAD